MSEDIKLTKLASCAGCGAKVGAGTLSRLLQDLPVQKDERLLVGFDKSDDAAVYKINDDTAIIQTIDFFPPIADDRTFSDRLPPAMQSVISMPWAANQNLP